MTILERLEQLHGKVPMEDAAIIVRRTLRGDSYLSGIPYLWSVFAERAFLFPCVADAQKIIDDFHLNASVKVFRS